MWRTSIYPLLAGAALSLCLTACSFPPNQALLSPVGPAPAGPVNHDSDGYLVVYSAWSNFVDQGSTPHHSRYILTADGRTLSQEIINHVDRFDEGPLRVPLTPGSYHVKARSAHFGRVTVPVIIKPHQTTFVYLDGSPHRDLPSGQQASAVKLPDGEIVGWSSQ